MLIQNQIPQLEILLPILKNKNFIHIGSEKNWRREHYAIFKNKDNLFLKYEGDEMNSYRLSVGLGNPLRDRGLPDADQYIEIKKIMQLMGKTSLSELKNIGNPTFGEYIVSAGSFLDQHYDEILRRLNTNTV